MTDELTRVKLPAASSSSSLEILYRVRWMRELTPAQRVKAETCHHISCSSREQVSTVSLNDLLQLSCHRHHGVLISCRNNDVMSGPVLYKK